MKKCVGCGVELQDRDNRLPGYSANLERDYCMRCFRLTHYGDISDLKSEIVKNEDIYRIYDDHNEALFVLIVDAFDGLNLNNDDLLKIFKNRKVLLVITKIDLLPKNVTDTKIDSLYREVLTKVEGIRLVDCLLTYKDDAHFNEVFYEILAESGASEVVFAGYANAGKSSLINRVLGRNQLTTSVYPGTTLMINEVKKDGYTFIDTPGIVDPYSFYTYLPSESLKQVLILKTVKPAVFQAYEDQSYFIEGLLRLDIKTKKNVSIVFMKANELEVHRGKLDRADEYEKKHVHNLLKLYPFKRREYRIKGVMSFYLKGLGVVKVSGDCVAAVCVNEKIRVFNGRGVL